MQAVEQGDRMASLMLKGHDCSSSQSTVQVEESYHFLRIGQVLSWNQQWYNNPAIMPYRIKGFWTSRRVT